MTEPLSKRLRNMANEPGTSGSAAAIMFEAAGEIAWLTRELACPAPVMSSTYGGNPYPIPTEKPTDEPAEGWRWEPSIDAHACHKRLIAPSGRYVCRAADATPADLAMILAAFTLMPRMVALLRRDQTTSPMDERQSREYRYFASTRDALLAEYDAARKEQQAMSEHEPAEQVATPMHEQAAQIDRLMRERNAANKQIVKLISVVRRLAAFEFAVDIRDIQNGTYQNEVIALRRDAMRILKEIHADTKTT